MTEHQIRAMLVEALENSSVHALRERGLVQGFLSGSEEVLLDSLEMDSLAQMELCIAIEVNAGVSIVPDNLKRIGTLTELVSTIQREQ